MSIKKDLANGVLYTSIAKYSNIIIGLVIASVLARLLTPADFGVVGIATVLITFFNLIGDIGIGPAIIQRQNLTNDDLKSIHSLTIYVGLLLGGIFFLVAPLIAKFYEDNTLITVCQLLSLDIFFTCCNIVPLNLQYKHKKFKAVAIVTLSVRITTGIASIIYAFKGGGVYALVLSSLLSTFLLALIYNSIAKIPFSFVIQRESINKIKSFSIFQFLFNLINYFSRNLDKLLIGRYIGMSQLGYYDKSYRLMMMPLQNITFVITPVLLPIFSELQADQSNISKKYLKLLNGLSCISFPLAALLFFCGKELMLLIFGSQWGPAVLPFKILSFTVAFQILTSTSGSIYQAVNATKQLFISGCWGAFFMVSSFIITIWGWHTVEAVCYGYLVAQIANTIQTFYLLFRTVKQPIFSLIKILVKPFVISCILWGLLFVVNYLTISYSLILSLVIKVFVGIVSTIALIHLSGEYNMVEFSKNMLNRKRK